MKAMQDKNSAIIKAEGEARSAELLGPALGIAQSLSKSRSKVYLDAETLMLNLTNSLD
jgi:hypothetical protein